MSTFASFCPWSNPAISSFRLFESDPWYKKQSLLCTIVKLRIFLTICAFFFTYKILFFVTFFLFINKYCVKAVLWFAIKMNFDFYSPVRSKEWPHIPVVQEKQRTYKLSSKMTWLSFLQRLEIRLWLCWIYWWVLGKELLVKPFYRAQLLAEWQNWPKIQQQISHWVDSICIDIWNIK